MLKLIIFRTTVIRFFFLFCYLSYLVSFGQGLGSIDPEIFVNQRDYSYMWWLKTIKTGNQVFAIKTNNYSLAYDYENLSLDNFSINTDGKSGRSVLKETNEESIPSGAGVAFRFGFIKDGKMNWITKSSGRDDDCQLVETGKYFQRRFITNLPDLEGFVPLSSGLEIASWPDRIAFILKLNLNQDYENLDIITQLTLPNEFTEIVELGELKAFKNPNTDSGYVLLKSSESTNISVSGSTVTVHLSRKGRQRKGIEFNAGIIVYPVAKNINSQLEKIAEIETAPLVVKAKQYVPDESPLQVRYNLDKGWHEIILRNDQVKNQADREDTNNGMERIEIAVANSSDKEQIVRLNFSKGRLIEEVASVRAITGISAMLRDFNGNPIGIPIQLSKNWHTGRKPEEVHYFRGPWFHGLTMLTIPANTIITFQYTSVNAHWGGVPAASHAQLCLIGWGANQQWDQSAIGAWGESITYEPDLDQASAPILDFRPLMVANKDGEKWGWTSNMGGADLLNYTKTDGNRSWHSRMRTQYKRYSPNFTEVTYSGIMDDNSMDFEYTASIGRSDDIIRGIYKIKLNVLKNTSFRDFVIFQVGASTYHFTNSKTLAWGNEHGLIKEWQATTGGPSHYINKKQVAEGNALWFSFTDSDFTVSRGKFIPANRGFIIREWKAKINGTEGVPPYFAEYNTTSGRHGGPSSLINITTPEGSSSLKEGDYIEAEIELILIPAKSADYYGPNRNFAQALAKKANTWEMVHREAIGNHLEISVSKGKLVDSYPIQIIAVGNEADFEVTGGLGFVPLTFTRVTSYRQPELYERVSGSWQIIDQSVHGNDFWQSDYDPVTKTWDISYNIDLDSPDDKRITREFKFRCRDMD